jgi:hypothetical protein
MSEACTRTAAHTLRDTYEVGLPKRLVCNNGYRYVS